MLTLTAKPGFEFYGPAGDIVSDETDLKPLLGLPQMPNQMFSASAW
jgi:hypothetical protein